MPTPASQPPKQVQRLIWGAHLFAICMFVVVGFITRSQSDPAGAGAGAGGEASSELAALLGSAPPAIVAVMGGLAVTLTLAGLALPPLFARGSTYLVYGLLRWSFAEVIAIFGLVVFQLGSSWLVFAAFFGWSATLLLLASPTARDEARYQRLRAERR